jgi:hypothetical protein
VGPLPPPSLRRHPRGGSSWPEAALAVGGLR